MTRPPFPEVWDSTMISAGRSCPQKLFLSYIQHWKPKSESEHLIAGKAFASGLEAARNAHYVEGADPNDAVAEGLGVLWREYGDFVPPEASAKTPLRMAGALEYYFSEYPLGRDGATPRLLGAKRGIEFSFAEPLPVEHPVTGEPLILSGRADMIADYQGGVFLFDEKTTKGFSQNWANEWDLRSQFTAYCWGLRSFGIRPTGVVVRGVAILKTQFQTRQCPTYRGDWEVERWLTQTCRDLERYKQMWKEGYWDYNLDHSCTEYGGCVFASRVCKSKDPEPWLQMYFERKRWDPLLRVEVKEERGE